MPTLRTSWACIHSHSRAGRRRNPLGRIHLLVLSMVRLGTQVGVFSVVHICERQGKSGWKHREVLFCYPPLSECRHFSDDFHCIEQRALRSMRKSRVQSQPCHLLAVWLWAICFTSLSLSFHICRFQLTKISFVTETTPFRKQGLHLTAALIL